MTLEKLAVDTLGGHATVEGSLELDAPYSTSLRFEGKDLQIGDLLRNEEKPGGVPSFEGLLTASATLLCPLAGIDQHAAGGGRASLTKARLGKIPVLTKIDEALDALAEQAIFTAQLLAGEMPQDIEEAFEEAGASLFPKKRGDLETECSCPDYANPCKHIAATHYILGERFDEDPFLIFRLRGRTQEE